MAWSWSHTGGAIMYAHDELWKLSDSMLLEILAEWRMHDKHPANDAAWPDQWPKALEFVQRLYGHRHKYVLVEAVWERAYEQRKCDNGGWNSWMCPYGCHPHCVDFGPEDSELHPRITREEVCA